MLMKHFEVPSLKKVLPSISELALQKTTTASSIQALFKNAAANRDDVFYVNRIGMISRVENRAPLQASMNDFQTFRASNLAGLKKPGRLVATFNSRENTVNFFLRPVNDDHKKSTENVFRTTALKEDTQSFSISRLHFVK